MKVCICRNVSDHAIRNAVAEGACSLRDLRAELGVASQCGKCSRFASQIIHESMSQQPEMVAIGAVATASA